MFALAPADGEATALLQPGAVQLELHTTPIDNPGPALPLPVTIVAEQGSRVRVAVRLPNARFLAWSERAQLFAMMVREHRIAPRPGDHGMPSENHATVRAGAAVRRLAHKDAWTKVRYSGVFEVEGWVPDAALGEVAPARERGGWSPRGPSTQLVTRGAVIYFEPRWGSRQLAIVDRGYSVEVTRVVDDAWSEVAYADRDLVIRGFHSKRAPPGRVHRKVVDPALAPAKMIPNTQVASGTCLHASVEGDPIGYLVGDQDVDLVDTGRGWWTLTIDTPWGPIVFAARGADPTALVACAPDKTVPPSTLVAPTAP